MTTWKPGDQCWAVYDRILCRCSVEEPHSRVSGVWLLASSEINQRWWGHEVRMMTDEQAAQYRLETGQVGGL